MTRKAYPKFVEISGHLISVSAIKTLRKSSGHFKNIDIEYYNGCETKEVSISYCSDKERDEAFNKIMEELL